MNNKTHPGIIRAGELEFLHTIVFVSFALASLSSPIIALKYPGIFSGYFFFGVIVLMVLVMITWHVYGGCPLTVWENELREHELRGSSYTGSCIQHYTLEWFGIHLSRSAGTRLLIALFLLPLVVTLVVKALLFFSL